MPTENEKSNVPTLKMYATVTRNGEPVVQTVPIPNKVETQLNPVLSLQHLHLVTFFLCPSCVHTSIIAGTTPSKGHYKQTLVVCEWCIAINNMLRKALSP
jgi:hypothetical protein